MTIPAIEFTEMLENDYEWTNMKGFTGKQPYIKQDVFAHQSYLAFDIVKSAKQQFKSNWWRYRPHGEYTAATYAQIEPYRDKVKLQVLHTPKEFRGQGLASAAIKSLQNMTNGIDYRCKHNDEFYLYDCFTLWLVPNPVDVVCKFPPEDWTSNFTDNFMDETFRDLGPYNDKPYAMEELISYYEKRGFVKSERLKYLIRNGKAHFNMSGRSWSLERPSMIYPAENLDLVYPDVVED